MLPQILLTIAALLILVLGTAHLAMTFTSDKLGPVDPNLTKEMKLSPLVLSAESDMWRAWVGFNASHSLGAILFGLVFGYLAVFHLPFLVASTFLSLLGGICLLGYVLLAKRYWFRAPLVIIGIALACYIAGFVLLRV